MSGLPRVVVVGGSGAFGSRLCEGLAATVACEVVVAGRDTDRAGRTASELLARHPLATVSVSGLNAESVTAADIGTLRAAVVVDAAGPYRPGSYGLARACVAAGVTYVDLADGRDFVAGFAGVLDVVAKASGVTAFCGASSTPALSNAALDELVRGWRAVDEVEVAISPGNRAPRGLSVFRSILSYVGKPVRVMEEGIWVEAHGWGLTTTRPMAGLGRRRLSLCQTPDLDIMPARYPGAHTVLFRAGLELTFLHDGLRLAALPVRLGLVPSLVPLAPALRTMATWFERLGTDRGGMEVVAVGVDETGAPARATWTLVAGEGDGPYVPTLPALALVRGILAGRRHAPGARACVDVLQLKEIEAEMRRFRIETRIDRHLDADLGVSTKPSFTLAS